jgi:hypothetical protein
LPCGVENPNEISDPAAWTRFVRAQVERCGLCPGTHYFRAKDNSVKMIKVTTAVFRPR